MGIVLQIGFIEREWGLVPRGKSTGKFIESICVIYASNITRRYACKSSNFKPS